MKRRRLGRGLYDLAASRFPAPSPGDAGRSGFPVRGDPGALPTPAAAAASATGPAVRPTIICVTSGKGGTGKSILTSNLAVHLATCGVKILALDADMGLANLHLLLGMRPSRTILEVIERGATLDEVSEAGPVGVKLAAGGSGIPEMADMHPERLRRLVSSMEALGDRADMVLVDTGAGIGRATTSFLYVLENILIVTTPDLTAMTDAYAVIKNVVHNNRRCRLSLVVNRATSAVEGLEVYGRMDRISRKFLGHPLLYLGHVLEDPRVPASVAARIPILLNQPAAPAAACLRGVGRSLLLEMGADRALGTIRTA